MEASRRRRYAIGSARGPLAGRPVSLQTLHRRRDLNVQLLEAVRSFIEFPEIRIRGACENVQTPVFSGTVTRGVI